MTTKTKTVLKPVVLSVSGILRKRVRHVGTVNNLQLWQIENDDYEHVFIEHDGHLFPTGARLDRLTAFLNEPENQDFSPALWLQSEFEHQLRRGNAISKGLAQYFNREEEAKAAVARFRAEMDEKNHKREAAKQAEREERQREHEKQLDEDAETYRNGDSIPGDSFLQLCERYGIAIPLRTKGWAMKNLHSAKKTSYRTRDTKSESIWKAITALSNVL